MPATLIPTVTADQNGAAWPASNGTAGDIVNENYYVNGPNVGLLVTNSAGVSGTFTLRTPGTVGKEGLTVEDPVKTLAAGITKLYGPYSREVYGDLVQFLASAVTMKFIPVQIPTA